MADQAQTVRIPERVPLGWSIDTRDASLNKDALLVNCYVERDKVSGVTSVFRRPGFSLWLHVTPPSPPNYAGGIYQGGGGFVYFTFAGVTFEYHNPTTPLINWGTGASSYVHVYYDSVMGGKPGTVISNGADSYLINLNQVVTGPFHSVDADFPSFTSPGWAYLDGTTYVMQSTLTPTSGGAVIYGSKINSVDGATSWDPLNTITAQMTPEGGIYIGKHLGYVIVLKENSTEFFYDVGNATGSPLAPAQNLFFSWGCVDPNTVQKISEDLVFVSTTKDVNYQVIVIQNTRPRVISTPAIDRILNSIVMGQTPHVYSWHFVIVGHAFYGLTLKDLNMTLVYDFAEDMWYQWTDKDGNYLPFVSVTGGSGIPFLAQHETNGSIYVWDSDYNADYIQEVSRGFSAFQGFSIPVTIRTPRWDGGTARYKTQNYLSFVGDVVPGKSLTVQYSDDDYQTWSTPRTVDLGMDLPNLIQLGRFRRRAFLIQNNDFLPFRLQAIELQVDIGTL